MTMSIDGDNMRTNDHDHRRHHNCHAHDGAPLRYYPSFAVLASQPTPKEAIQVPKSSKQKQA